MGYAKELNVINNNVSQKALHILKQYYGYDYFKKGQALLIENILTGKDVMGIMPTGAGKSICYQVPAMLLDGVTLVISPLISLMKDQVDSLNELGIKAAFINSSLSLKELHIIFTNARLGVYKLVYVAPERIATDSFIELIQTIQISLVAVDEAHCVSQWGHDFRPSYKQIAQMVNSLPIRPVFAAFTATATPRVKDDIIHLLELRKPYSLTTGFDRENLFFEVNKPQDKFEYLVKYLRKKIDKSGLIYCSTRKTVEMVCDRLNKNGFSATKYHAGLTDIQRTHNQDAFIFDHVQIMVATNAFGMGIDKSNISFVIHYNMPKSMESYYQEAGRAGRDGEAAECLLLFGLSDIVTNKFLIEKGSENNDKTEEYKKLNDMVIYCNTDKCLRAYILSYFGEQETADNCKNCGNCNSNIISTVITIEAQKIMSCIKRMGERYGGAVVADVLWGANTSKIKEMGFDKLTTYGIMKDYSKETIKGYISFLIAEGYIEQTTGQYPVLSLNALSYEVFNGIREVNSRLVFAKTESIEKKNKPTDIGLFGILRSIRKELAEEQNVPPFVIFSDATLNDMCRKYPTSDEAMLTVSGVGEFKLKKFGEVFVEAIKEYVIDNNIEISVVEPKKSKIKLKVKETNSQKPDTRLVTYDLYKSGRTLDEIVDIRGLLLPTVEGHLVDCYKNGMDINLDSLIPKEYEQQILDAIKVHGNEKLKAIKDELPNEISYGAIKFVICKYF